MSAFKEFFQFGAPTRVVAGHGLIEGAGFEFRKEGAKRPLIVTDEVLRGTGLVDRVAESLEPDGLELAGIYDSVPPDSDTAVVEACAAAARDAGADSFLAVGGGSVLDTAKAANVLFVHGGELAGWEGIFALPRQDGDEGRQIDLAPMCAIPTTAGTGAESSPVAIIKDAERQIKFLILDWPLSPDVAILDPESTATLPASIAAATGMDALTHAIEAVISTEWSPHGDAYALHAIRLIRENLERAVADTADEDARGNMLVAANLAIAPTGLGASGIVHSMSHPAGARYGVAHGVANAICLPWVIEFNSHSEEYGGRLADCAELMGVETAGGPVEIGRALAERVRELTRTLGLPTRLSQVGVPEAGIAQLADDAMGEGPTLANPREVSEEEFVELYEKAL